MVPIGPATTSGLIGPKCQFCDELGHTAKNCPQLKPSEITANSATTSTMKEQKWLLDSAASHNITGDLQNLSIHSEYDGTDEVVLGDGSGLAVSHVGSLAIHSPNRTFILRDTLCVPNLKKILISVHHFTSQNNVYVEFHPSYFLVKEPITGAILLRGSCENDIYIFPESLVGNFSQKVANVHERTSLDGWHKRLGHPSYPIVKNLVSTFSLPTTTNKMTMLCHSCSINKSHQQPFRTTSLSSTGPLEIIYTDVWGPTHSTGLDGSRYYLFFVDHYTKYMWFYPMATKSSVSTIFPQFKIFVETRFQAKIKTLYSDNGGEFISLKPFLNLHGISHYTTAPYTPQQNGVSERRHRHLVETGLTLLSDASLSLSYWPHAFRTATYLINRQPTPFLTNKSPFEALFGLKPNYLKLKKFGSLCYPLTRPYNNHKMQPKSIPCLFLGYSQTQNAYICLDLKTHKTNVSRHVLFDETQLLFQSEQAQSPAQLESSSHLCPTSFIPFSFQPVRVPSQVIPSVHSSDSAPSHVLPADVSAASPSPPGNPPLSSPNFPLTDVLRHSGSHSDVLISHDPVLPSSLHPTHTHTVADLTLSQSHSIPPSCVQTGNPRLHKMTTRSMNNIFKPKQLHLVSKHPIPLAIEPTCVTQAVNHPQWRDAMSTELIALMKHGTWDLVPPPQIVHPWVVNGCLE